MKKQALVFIALILSVFASSTAQAQCHDCPSDDIRTLANSTRHFGFYGGIGFRSTKLKDESLMMAGIRLGFIANRSLGIGFEGYGIIPTNTYPDVIPGQSVIALGGYGGLTLEPIFFSNRAVHVTFPVTGGAGWLGYHTDWKNQQYYESILLSEDVFWYVEPGINAEINISRAMRLHLGVSKRFVQDLDLINTAAPDFETLTYSFGIKIGRF